jgi:hypothetical protein
MVLKDNQTLGNQTYGLVSRPRLTALGLPTPSGAGCTRAPLPTHHVTTPPRTPPTTQLYSKTMTVIKPLSTDGFQSPNNTISHTPHVLGPWKSCAGIFTLSVFEKPNPGAMYVSTFKQDSITGGRPSSGPTLPVAREGLPPICQGPVGAGRR